MKEVENSKRCSHAVMQRDDKVVHEGDVLSRSV
jgi:hypothetical protein